MSIPTQSYIIDTTRSGNVLKIISNIGIIMPQGSTTDRPNNTGNPDVISTNTQTNLIFAGTLRFNSSTTTLSYIEPDIAWKIGRAHV